MSCVEKRALFRSLPSKLRWNMKSKDELESLRAMEAEALRSRIAETERELMNLSFRQASNQLEHTAQFKTLRRSIARQKTILKEITTAAAQE